jgi:ABC-type multidrug transport system fused ATPase/permease subunit
VGSWRQLLHHTNPFSVVALVVCSVASGVTEAGLLAAVAQIAAALVTGDSHTNVELGAVSLSISIDGLLLVAFGLAVARLLLQIPVSIIPGRVASDVQAGLRRRLFNAFTDASWTEQASDREGHLQELATSHTVLATQGSLQFMTMISALGAFLILIVSSMLLNPLATGIVVVVSLLLFGALRPLSSLGHRHAKELSAAQMQFASGIGEAIRMSEETQVFGVGSSQKGRIEGLAAQSRHLYFLTQLWGRLVPSLYQSLVYLIVVGGLAVIYEAGAGHAASIGAVVLLLVRAGTYAQQVQSAYQAARQSLPFIERLEVAERLYSENRRPTGNRSLSAVDRIAFEDVSFSYREGVPVLSGLTFHTNGGETIGVVGPSGAGKSTMVQLLLRLRTPDRGHYLINGDEALDIKPDDWHRQVGYVPQEPRLTHASVAENIRYFREDIGDADIERAAKLARIHDDIIGWSQGYDTIVGPRADAVSGGQRQRLCMARALASNPTFMVLDEPTSALDPRSEALLQQSLMGLAGDMSLFIIAHRMSTLNICDRVMVVVGGRLDALASADDLLKENSYFRSAHSISVGDSG